MSEYPQDNPPNVPLHDTTSAFEQPSRLFLLSMLVLSPCELTISASLGVLQMVQFCSFVRYESRKYEDRFDVKFFENTKVLFDSLNKSQRRTASSCKKRLSRWWVVQQSVKIM